MEVAQFVADCLALLLFNLIPFFLPSQEKIFQMHNFEYRFDGYGEIYEVVADENKRTKKEIGYNRDTSRSVRPRFKRTKQIMRSWCAYVRMWCRAIPHVHLYWCCMGGEGGGGCGSACRNDVNGASKRTGKMHE